MVIETKEIPATQGGVVVDQDCVRVTESYGHYYLELCSPCGDWEIVFQSELLDDVMYEFRRY